MLAATTLTAHQLSAAPSKVALELDSRPLHGRGEGGRGERLPRGTLMPTLGEPGREKQKRSEAKRSGGEEEESKKRR